MQRIVIAAPAIGLMLLVPAGCQYWKPRAILQEQPTQVAAAPAAAAVGRVAPEIDAEDMNGQRLQLADYKGQVVVLHFWANW